MLRFTVAVPFKPEAKVHVVMEGLAFHPKDVLALRRAFAEAAVAVLSPDFKAWLASKGGACPAHYPELVQHSTSGDSSECVHCHETVKTTAALAAAAAPPVATEEAPKPKGKSKSKSADEE